MALYSFMIWMLLLRMCEIKDEGALATVKDLSTKAWIFL